MLAQPTYVHSHFKVASWAIQFLSTQKCTQKWPLISSIPHRHLGEILPPFWVLVNKVVLIFSNIIFVIFFLYDLIALVILTFSVCAYYLVWVTFISLRDSFFISLCSETVTACTRLHKLKSDKIAIWRRKSGHKVPCLSRKLLTNNSFCGRGKPVSSTK